MTNDQNSENANQKRRKQRITRLKGALIRDALFGGAAHCIVDITSAGRSVVQGPAHAGKISSTVNSQRPAYAFGRIKLTKWRRADVIELFPAIAK